MSFEHNPLPQKQTQPLKCFKPRSKCCNLSQPVPQTEMQKCYCHFPRITTCTFTCLPFHFLTASLGGSSKPIQHPLILPVECLEVGQALHCAALSFPGGPSSVTQGSAATPSFFLESLGGWWPPSGRARTDVAPSRAHQPQPGLREGHSRAAGCSLWCFRISAFLFFTSCAALVCSSELHTDVFTVFTFWSDKKIPLKLKDTLQPQPWKV